jgi:hypothetical protein
MKKSTTITYGLIFCLFALGIFLMGSKCASEAILSNNMLPGYYFQSVHESYENVAKCSQYDTRYSSFKHTKNIRIFHETWATVTKEELLNSWKDKNKRANLIYSEIHVDRYYLDNCKEALEYAKLLMAGSGSLRPPSGQISDGSYEDWTEGGYSVSKIGQKCWTNKNSYYNKIIQKGNGLMIYFIKDNIVVCVSGAGDRESTPMDPNFVEKIAIKVDKRL